MILFVLCLIIGIQASFKYIDCEQSSYEVLSVLGTGGYATVYKAENTKTGQLVAVKVYDKSEMQSFYREVNALIAFKGQRNLIQLICQRVTRKVGIAVLEYFARGDLLAYIKRKRKGRLSESRTWKFLNDLANGMKIMYSKSYIHRDLKPENLLISDDRVLKIADFGASNLLAPDRQTTDPTGTALYAAPERLYDYEYDRSADIWSVGVVLYFMLTGDYLFATVDGLKLRKSDAGAVRDQMKRYYELNQEVSLPDHIFVSDDLEDLLSDLLRPNPTHRLTFDQFYKRVTTRNSCFNCWK